MIPNVSAFKAKSVKQQPIADKSYSQKVISTMTVQIEVQIEVQMIPQTKRQTNTIRLKYIRTSTSHSLLRKSNNFC